MRETRAMEPAGFHLPDVAVVLALGPCFQLVPNYPQLGLMPN